METTTIEQACDPSNWKWKCWDVRSDGMVFWSTRKGCRNNEYWITWDKAIEYRRVNRECARKYRIKNIDSVKLKLSRWRSENKKRVAQYVRDRRKYNLIHAMSCRVRDRIKGCLNRKSIKKTSKTRDMLGCDWTQLKHHLESKFVDGMSWENRSLWHIDHIVPLASAKSVDEVIKLSHYTNLQPLWAKENQTKWAKLNNIK